MTDIGKVAQLKQLLFGMEKDLGIQNLSETQQNILYAASLLAVDDNPVETEDIRNHQLLGTVARSTFFKALRELVDFGYLRHTSGAQRSQYLLTEKFKGN
jgi:hypothetical protein